MNASVSSSPARRALLTAGAAVGPVLLAIGTALDPVGRVPDVADYLALVDSARGAYLASGLVLWAGMALLPVTAFGVLRATGTRRGVRTLRAGAVLIAVWGVLGATGVAAGYTAGWVGVDTVGRVSPDVVERVFTGIVYGPWGTIGGAAGGVAWGLAMLLAGIGAILARGVPAWAGALLLASVPAALLGGSLGLTWSTVAGFLLLAVGVVGVVGSRSTVGVARTGPVTPAPRATDLVQ